MPYFLIEGGEITVRTTPSPTRRRDRREGRRTPLIYVLCSENRGRALEASLGDPTGTAPLAVRPVGTHPLRRRVGFAEVPQFAPGDVHRRPPSETPRARPLLMFAP